MKYIVVTYLGKVFSFIVFHKFNQMLILPQKLPVLLIITEVLKIYYFSFDQEVLFLLWTGFYLSKSIQKLITLYIQHIL